MDVKAVEFLFSFGGVSMMVHGALSQLVRYLIGWNSELALQLFAVPNAAIAPDWGFRLLRTVYYLPWRPLPRAITDEPLVVRLLLQLTRLSGLLVPVALLAMIASLFFVVP